MENLVLLKNCTKPETLQIKFLLPGISYTRMFAIFANGNLLLVFGIFAHNSYTKSYQQLAIEFKSTAVGSHVSNLFFIAFYLMEDFVTCNECSLMMTIERNGCKKGAFLLHILILSIEAGASKYYVSIFAESNCCSNRQMKLCLTCL